MSATEISERLRRELDFVGWRPPWHYHWRIVQPAAGPPRAENCAPSECEAPGCPRTESGYPAEIAEAIERVSRGGGGRYSIVAESEADAADLTRLFGTTVQVGDRVEARVAVSDV